jgi:hypothetical protein
MTGSILDSVRSACAEVARKAHHVHIDEQQVATYADRLPLQQAMTPAIDPAHHHLAGPEATLAFILTLDTINFGSGYFPHLRKRAGLSGYFTVATSLKERFEAAGPFAADELTRLTSADCLAIFGQDPDGGPVEELMLLFARALNDLGHFLQGRFAGRFTGLVEAAGHSAERLVELLAEMPLFRDVQPYDGLTVPFYKRGQLTAADLALALRGAGLGRFDDLDRLTIFADNLVPHVLRRDGILRYDADLAHRIDRQVLILPGSPEEVEIRACAVHAVELIGTALRGRGTPVTSMGLDYLLWNRGQQPRYKAHPRHRTRTVYY